MKPQAGSGAGRGRLHAKHCTAAAAGAVSDELVSRRMTPPSLLPSLLPYFILSPQVKPGGSMDEEGSRTDGRTRADRTDGMR